MRYIVILFSSSLPQCPYSHDPTQPVSLDACNRERIHLFTMPVCKYSINCFEAYFIAQYVNVSLLPARTQQTPNPTTQPSAPFQPPDMNNWECKFCNNVNFWQRTRCMCTSIICVHYVFASAPLHQKFLHVGVLAVLTCAYTSFGRQHAKLPKVTVRTPGDGGQRAEQQ